MSSTGLMQQQIIVDVCKKNSGHQLGNLTRHQSCNCRPNSLSIFWYFVMDVYLEVFFKSELSYSISQYHTKTAIFSARPTSIVMSNINFYMVLCFLLWLASFYQQLVRNKHFMCNSASAIQHQRQTKEKKEISGIASFISVDLYRCKIQRWSHGINPDYRWQNRALSVIIKELPGPLLWLDTYKQTYTLFFNK